MQKCPYCFEQVELPSTRCTHCLQFFLDKPIESEFKSADKKNCLFCGKRIFSEATVCKYCHKWLDEVHRAADELE